MNNQEVIQACVSIKVFLYMYVDLKNHLISLKPIYIYKCTNVKQVMMS